MQKALSATLYEDNNPNAAYERVISDLPVEQLRSAMDVNTDKELISVLKRDYGTSDAFDRFSEFVYDNHLKYNIYCG